MLLGRILQLRQCFSLTCCGLEDKATKKLIHAASLSHYTVGIGLFIYSVSVGNDGVFILLESFTCLIWGYTGLETAGFESHNFIGWPSIT